MADKIATRASYGNVLKELGAEMEDLVVMDADLSGSTKTKEFAKVYPDRFFNMGIAEQNMYGYAAGLALSGKTVCASTFAMFAAGRAYEIIRNSIGYTRANVKICATHAGITVGADGASHQTFEDIALMRNIPGMTVINPSDDTSAKALLRQAIKMDGPVYVRLGRAAVPVFYGEDAIIIKAAKETGKIVTAEEHSVIGGLGSAVCEVLSEECPVKVKRVGQKDTYGESGQPDELLEKYGMTEKDIVSAALEVLG